MLRYALITIICMYITASTLFTVLRACCVEQLQNNGNYSIHSESSSSACCSPMLDINLLQREPFCSVSGLSHPFPARSFSQFVTPHSECRNVITQSVNYLVMGHYSRKLQICALYYPLFAGKEPPCEKPPLHTDNI